MKRSDYRRRGDPVPESEKEATTVLDPSLRWISVKATPPIERNVDTSIYKIIKDQSDQCAQFQDINVQIQKIKSVQENEVIDDDDEKEVDDDEEKEKGDEWNEWSRPLILVPESSRPSILVPNSEQVISDLNLNQPQLTPLPLPFDFLASLPPQIESPQPPKVDLHNDSDSDYNNDIEIPSCSKNKKSDQDPQIDDTSNSDYSLSSTSASSFKLRFDQENNNNESTNKRQRRNLKNHKYTSSDESSENWDDEENSGEQKQENLPLMVKKQSSCGPESEKILSKSNNLKNNATVRLVCSLIKVGRVLVSAKSTREEGIIDFIFKDSVISIKVDTPRFLNKDKNSYGAQFSISIPYSSVISFKVNENSKIRRNTYFLELTSEMCKTIRSIFNLKDWQFDSKNDISKLFKFSTIGFNCKKEDLDILKLIFDERFEFIDETAYSYLYYTPKSFYTVENKQKQRRRSTRSKSPRSPRRSVAGYYFMSRSRSRSSSRSQRSNPGSNMIPRRSGETERILRQRREHSSSPSDIDNYQNSNKSYKEFSDNSEVAIDKKKLQILHGNERDKICLTSNKTIINCYQIKFGCVSMSAIGIHQEGKIEFKLSSSTIEIDVNTPHFNAFINFKSTGTFDDKVWRISIPTEEVVSLQVYTNGFWTKNNKNIFFFKLTPTETRRVRDKFLLNHHQYNESNDAHHTLQYFTICTTVVSTINEDLQKIEKIFQNRIKYIPSDVSQYYLGKGENPRPRRERSHSRNRSRNRSKSNYSSSRSRSLSKDNSRPRNKRERSLSRNPSRNRSKSICSLSRSTSSSLPHGGDKLDKKCEKSRSQSHRHSRSRSPHKRISRKRILTSESRSPKRLNSLPAAVSTSSSLPQTEGNLHLFTFIAHFVHFGTMAFKNEVKVSVLPSTKCVSISMKSIANEPVELTISHESVEMYYLAEFKTDESIEQHDCLILFIQIVNKFEKIIYNLIGSDLYSNFNPESKSDKHKYIILLIKTENKHDLEKKRVIINAVLGDNCKFMHNGGEDILEILHQIIHDRESVNDK